MAEPTSVAMGGASSLLKPLARVVLPFAQKLRAERHAGQNPFSVDTQKDSLDQQFEAALGRLGAIDKNKVYWKKLLVQMGSAFMQPDFFKLPSVQEWLSNEQVKVDFKTIARMRLIGGSIDDDVLDRIKGKYSESTGEAAYRATYAIAVVLAVMHVSVQVTLTPGEGVITAMLRDMTVENREANKRAEASIDQIALTEDPLYGEKLSEALSMVIKLRATPGNNSINEIESLIARIENGELALAPKADKAEAYYWAARIFSPYASKAAQAKKYLETYRAFPSSESDKVTFIEAWLREADGHRQCAIDIFSDLDNPDARTGLLTLISKRDGKAAALEWLNDHDLSDSTLLNPVGWRNAAIMLAEEERWQEAIDLLNDLPDDLQISFPELLFIKGVLHACFLLPEPIRLRLFRESNINFKAEAQEGELASRHRNQSMEALHQARELMINLGAERRAHGCDYHLMWIRLTDPHERNAAQAELIEGMKDGVYAAFMLDIALNFDITFDRKPLERYLRVRKRERREEPQDHGAKLSLLQKYGTPNDTISYLEEEAIALKEIMAPVSLASIKIHALMEDNRIADADLELERCKGFFPPEELERHRFMLADRKGEELNNLEALYKRTGQYIDLLNLVNYLERSHQWNSLIPHAKSLLKKRHTTSDLWTVIRAMREAGFPSAEIILCLEDNQDLIITGTDDGDELLLSKGWALFSLGRFTEAQLITNEFASRTPSPSAISLELNLVLRTGQWEHFQTIIDREFSRLEEFPPQLLLQMASVVSDWDQDRAILLAGIAVEKDPDNGVILSNAYWLASQIDREIDAAKWLERLIKQANQGEGPLQSVSLREMSEMMPARAEQRHTWEQQYSTGEIDVHSAAMLLNVPVAHILIGSPLRNESNIDARNRSVIPFRHGGRGIINLHKVQRISFDLSSLLVLEHLEILETTFNMLEKVYLSPRLMDVLFIELRQVRFHQPSLVEEARRIRELIADDVIQILRNVHPPKELVEEVGEEMANLLNKAQLTGGRVLATLPVHKAGSLDNEVANLGDYGPLVLKTTQLLPQFEGQLSPEAYSRALSFLTSADAGEKLGLNELGDGPLFIDSLALRYLDMAGVIQNIRHIRRDIFVDHSVSEDIRELINTSSYGDQVAAVIERLRKRIRYNIQNGKVGFLPESTEVEEPDSFLRIISLQDVIATTEDADAVCLDDRAISKHANVTDRHGRSAPIVGSIDVLEHLATQDLITEEKKRTCEFRLRKGGFAFLPLNADEMLESLKASIDPTKPLFTENRDLISIRENLLRIRSIKILRLPEEVLWFSQLAKASRKLLTEIWNDDNIGIVMAEKMSDWVLDVLSPLPTAWQDSIILEKDEQIEEPTKFALLQLINTGLLLLDPERKAAFANWIENSLIKPLLPANDSLVDEISHFLWPHITKIAKEIADELD